MNMMPSMKVSAAILPLAAIATTIAARPARKRAAPRTITRVTPTSLRAEGILEIGCATGTSVLFVRTRVKLHLLHVAWLPERQLDAYAVNLAVAWIETQGLSSCKVAKNLGVSQDTLRRALIAAGYVRLKSEQRAQPSRARSTCKTANRRGRLVRVGIPSKQVRA